jgi:predicted dinucleotide-binding enzyme
LIGAGNIGSQVARAAIVSGYDVVISNSRGPETLVDLVAELGREPVPVPARKRPRLVIWS